MQVHSSRLLVFALAGLVACTTADGATLTTAIPPIYTHDESIALLMCAGLADTAGSIAQQKLDNVPLEEVKSRYASLPDASVAKMGAATADKVYAETVTSWWTYEVSFFEECALNLAGVPAGRVGPANRCLQDNMVADEAYGFKSLHTPKAEALAYLARFGIKGPIPEAIVGGVYATEKERPQIKLELWNLCMSQYAAGDDRVDWNTLPSASRAAADPAAVGLFKGSQSTLAGPPQADRPVIYILRESGAKGLETPFQLSLDGGNLGDIRPGSHYAVTVAPGAHVIDVSANRDRDSLTLTAEAGSTHFVKVERLGTISVRVRLQEIDAISGRSIVSSSSLAGELQR